MKWAEEINVIATEILNPRRNANNHISNHQGKSPIQIYVHFIKGLNI